MRFYLPLGQSPEIDQQDMPVVDPRSSHDEVVEVIRQGHQIIDLVLLKFEGLDDVFNLHSVQVHKKDFVV